MGKESKTGKTLDWKWYVGFAIAVLSCIGTWVAVLPEGKPWPFVKSTTAPFPPTATPTFTSMPPMPPPQLPTPTHTPPPTPTPPTPMLPTPVPPAPIVLLYDDFASGSLDPSLWTFDSNSSEARWQIQDDILMIHGGWTNGGGGWILSSEMFEVSGGTLVLETRIRVGGLDWGNTFGFWRFRPQPAMSTAFWAYREGYVLAAVNGYEPCPGSQIALQDIDPTTWHTYRIEIVGGSTATFYVDGQSVASSSQCVPQSGGMPVRLDQSSQGQDQVLYVDYVKVSRQ